MQRRDMSIAASTAWLTALLASFRCAATSASTLKPLTRAEAACLHAGAVASASRQSSRSARAARDFCGSRVLAISGDIWRYLAISSDISPYLDILPYPAISPHRILQKVPSRVGVVIVIMH